MSAPVALSVRVVENGVPLPGVAVSLTAALPPFSAEHESHEAAVPTFLSSGTALDGTCRLEVPVPQVVRTLDVVVHQPGYRGPYTDAQWRQHWGPFAPSARVRLDRDALPEVLVIELEQLP